MIKAVLTHKEARLSARPQVHPPLTRRGTVRWFASIMLVLQPPSWRLVPRLLRQICRCLQAMWNILGSPGTAIAAITASSTATVYVTRCEVM